MHLRHFYFIVFLLVFCVLSNIDGKRSGSSRRSKSSSSGSSGWGLFTRKEKPSAKQKVEPVQAPKPAQAVPQPKPAQPAPQPKPAQPAKPAPSAPKAEPEIRKDNANLQQSAPGNTNQRPVGWNVDGHQQKQSVSGQQSAYPQQNGYGQAPGSYPQQHGGYPQQHGAYPQQLSGYPQQHGAYPQQNGYGHNPAGYPQQHGGYPQQHGAYPQQNGYGGYPMQNGYHPNPGGYGGFGGYGGYGQSPWMSQSKGSGFLGSLFGGRKQSMGYGPFGYGGYGYGMKKSSGFFGKNVFRNALIGLFAWQLISGLTRRPYHVYNYYNVPKEEREEISLPPNVLTLCNENATSLCVPGTTALCTVDNTFLCVTTMTAAAPCKDNNGELCVNSTIPCLDKDDPICQNSTVSSDNTATINLPCFTNMTLEQADMVDLGNVTLPKSEDNKYCVTTMAIPDNTNATVTDSGDGLQSNLTNAEVAKDGFNGTVAITQLPVEISEGDVMAKNGTASPAEPIK